jgi:dipeptidyl-peptidase-4
MDPATLHLYSVSDNTETAPNKPLCISCGIHTVVDGSQCLYVRSTFSLNSSYYTLTCTGPSVPEVAIFNKVFTHSLLTDIFVLLLSSFITCCESYDHIKVREK